MNLDVDFAPYRQGLASRQHLITRGWNSPSLTAALKEELIFRRCRGVYARTKNAPAPAGHLLTDHVLDRGYLERVREVMISLSDQACVGGRTMCLLYGWDLLVEPTTVEVVLPAGSWFRRAGITVTQLEERDTVKRSNLGFEPVSGLSRVDTVLHCAAFLPLIEAVTIADSALRSKTVTLEQLKKAVRARHGKRGYRRMRKVIDWADPQCGSVLESAFRVVVREGGIVPPESQVTLAGVGRVDFAWREQRLVVECDGRRWHDPDDARNTDRRRHNGLTLNSWVLLRFTWAEVMYDREYVLESVRTALKGWMSAA